MIFPRKKEFKSSGVDFNSLKTTKVFFYFTLRNIIKILQLEMHFEAKTFKIFQLV